MQIFMLLEKIPTNHPYGGLTAWTTKQIGDPVCERNNSGDVWKREERSDEES